MTMCYHIDKGNGQFSKPKNHFVRDLEPWEYSFYTIHFLMDNA
jgi:hypothetical protein